MVEDETNENEGIFVLKRLKNKNRIDRFKNEIEAGLNLKHPNIIEVLDYDLNVNKKPYLVTAYYEKGNLSELKLENFSINEKLDIFKSICNAVGYAHQKGIIHRDLKPENIFLAENNHPIVGDFGICFFSEEENKRVTLTEEAVGPYYYMAPELEDGRYDKIKPVSDVYSLGKILYWLISNGKMFAREKHRDTSFDISHDDKFIESHLINEYLDNMIVADPSKRYNNAKDVEKAISILERRVKMNAHSIGPETPQLCTYCGLGYYKKVVSYKNDDGIIRQIGYGVENFGFRRVGSPIWMILVCENCGNTQIFRPEYTDNYEKWIK